MYKYYLFLFISFGIFVSSLPAQNVENFSMESLKSSFEKQINMCPQEKAYIHTDRPYYMAGEQIRFRVHLADARSLHPLIASRYVYVELINPPSSVVCRVKVRTDSLCYHGQINLDEKLPTGNYFLRAYTFFMQNAGTDYFGIKKIYISQPPPMADSENESAKNSSKKAESATSKKEDKKKSKYDVSFFPESGYLLEGVNCRVAFKALYQDGKPADISGNLVDKQGNVINSFKTLHAGMGYFTFTPEKTKKYYIECKDSADRNMRFELPEANPDHYAINVNNLRDKIYLSVQKNGNKTNSDTVLVVAQTCGIVQFAGQWDFEKEYISFPKNTFTPGVMHILLLNAHLQPLGERLVFIDNPAMSQSVIETQTDKQFYKKRDKVEYSLFLKDEDNEPLEGNFSVSVTCDDDVKADTTSNIFTTLLLTSDLRGYIDEPNYYFSRTKASDLALDLLMMTHGWRRYDVPKIIEGKISKPSFFLEVGPQISGQVKSTILRKPLKNLNVTLVSMNGKCFETTQTDSLGRFYFHQCEQPDSTKFLVNAVKTKKIDQTELIMNEDVYPSSPNYPVLDFPFEENNMQDYLKKAIIRYEIENGMRMVYLNEVEIKAKRKSDLKTSPYYTHADNTLTEEQINRMSSFSIRTLLMQMSGVFVSGNSIRIRNASGDPLLVVDNVTMDISEIDMIETMDVAQIDLLKNAASTAMFGSQGGNGVIVIYTKEGKVSFNRKPFNIQMITPLGYQTPSAFYAPKYDTPETKSNPNIDWRATIHWQPYVSTGKDGKVTFDFYTSDSFGTYTVITEGISNDGRIIFKTEKIKVEE